MDDVNYTLYITVTISCPCKDSKKEIDGSCLVSAEKWPDMARYLIHIEDDAFIPLDYVPKFFPSLEDVIQDFSVDHATYCSYKKAQITCISVDDMAWHPDSV